MRNLLVPTLTIALALLAFAIYRVVTTDADADADDSDTADIEPHPTHDPPDFMGNSDTEEDSDSEEDPPLPPRPTIDETDTPLIEAATLSDATVRLYDHPLLPIESGAIIDVSAGAIQTQLRVESVLIDGEDFKPSLDGTPLVLEGITITYYPDADRAEIGWGEDDDGASDDADATEDEENG